MTTIVCLAGGLKTESRVKLLMVRRGGASRPLDVMKQSEANPSTRYRIIGEMIEAADVVLRKDGNLWMVKVLPGRETVMFPQRLQDLLDLYRMVVARQWESMGRRIGNKLIGWAQPALLSRSSTPRQLVHSGGSLPRVLEPFDPSLASRLGTESKQVESVLT